MQLSKRIVLGLTLASLTACGTLSPPPKPIKQKPDPAWTVEVPVPVPAGRDDAALSQWAKALREALLTANAQLAAIREWAEVK